MGISSSRTTKNQHVRHKIKERRKEKAIKQKEEVMMAEIKEIKNGEGDQKKVVIIRREMMKHQRKKNQQRMSKHQKRERGEREEVVVIKQHKMYTVMTTNVCMFDIQLFSIFVHFILILID